MSDGREPIYCLDVTASQLDDLEEALELYLEDRIQAFYGWMRLDDRGEALWALEAHRQALHLYRNLRKSLCIAAVGPAMAAAGESEKPGPSANRTEGSAMSMFDFYEPVPALRCPVCSQPLTTWQGKQGPRICLVWRQGHADAVGDALDGEPIYRDLPGSPLRLPPEFRIHSYDCPRHHPIHANCECADGMWIRTTLPPFEAQEADR
jgi:hypothetical protein